jgi:hypothetical protein
MPSSDGYHLSCENAHGADRVSFHTPQAWTYGEPVGFLRICTGPAQDRAGLPTIPVLPRRRDTRLLSDGVRLAPKEKPQNT